MKYVYLIKSENESVYKIGVGVNPEKRLKTLQTGNQSKLIILNKFLTDHPYKVENALHNFFSPLKEHGEWFNLTLEDELNFIPLCEKINHNLELIKESSLEKRYLDRVQ